MSSNEEEALRQEALGLSARLIAAEAAGNYAEAARLRPLRDRARFRLALAEGTATA